MSDKPKRLRFSLRSLILLVALAGSAFGLWAQSNPWSLYKTLAIENDDSIVYVQFSDDGKFIYGMKLTEGIKVWSLETRLQIEVDTQPKMWEYRAGLSHDGTKWANFGIIGSGSLYVTGTTQRGDYHMLGDYGIGYHDAAFSADDTMVVASSRGNIWVWKRNRPDRPWSIIFLPEFWMTAVLICGLLASVWKDQKTLASPTASP